MKKETSFWTKIKRIFFWSIILFFGTTIGITLLYRFINPPITYLMVERRMVDGYKIQKKWVPIEDISPNMYTALIASEDNLFTSHHGFDLDAIRKAKKYNKKMKGKKTRGASTISQQTAKNVFLWPGRSYIRKGFEVYFTFLIETCWSKERIMEVYLNVIETGKGIYGVEQASQVYFHKPAKKLSAGQAALIAACVPNPRKFSPGNPSGYIYKRQGKILNLMPKIITLPSP